MFLESHEVFATVSGTEGDSNTLKLWNYFGCLMMKVSLKDCYAFLNTYIYFISADILNKLSKEVEYFDHDNINRKTTFWIRSDYFNAVSQEGFLFWKTKIDQSTNNYWGPLPSDKIHAYTDTLIYTHKLYSEYKLVILFFFLSLMILFLELVLLFAGGIPLLCASSPKL